MRSLLPWLVLLLSLGQGAFAALLVIDYGAEWTKASLMKPGTPFDVLLDKDSKRKMMSVVGWKRDERVFGGEAVNAAARFPLTHFPFVKPLLATTTPIESDLYPVPLEPHPTGSLVFPHASAPLSALHPSQNSTGSHTHWTPEELLAQQFAYVRGVAEAQAQEIITDLYLTVPSYFTQAQRKAMRDAADIAGMSVTGMISEGGAVGLNYALTRSFPTKEYHLIYDSGAMKTTATILSFETISVKPEGASKRSKALTNTTYVDVIAFASEEQLGGVDFDLILRNMMIEDFEKGKGKGLEVRKDARAMRRLMKEAQRVKMVLSANSETVVGAESLTNDVDYRSRISRSQLEEASTAFKGRYAKPIKEALKTAGMTVDQLDSLILFGGNTRVPMVQAAVKEVISADKIAQNVNTDEAAVLGAAFYGASLSKSFRAKVELKLNEITPYDIEYSYQGKKQGSLFPAGTNVTQRKVLSFKTREDFWLSFEYAGAKSGNILDIALHGIPAILSNLTESEVSEAVVNVTMQINSQGILRATNAVLITTQKPESMKGKLFGLFGGGGDQKDAVKAIEDGEGTAEEKAELLKALEEELKAKERRIAIKFTESAPNHHHASAEARKASRQRLAAINAVEKEILDRAEARNLLEGYLYRLQDLLDPETYKKELQEHSTEDEKKRLTEGLKESLEWLSMHADEADTVTLKAKRAALETIETPIITRFRERLTRPKAIEDFQAAMFAGRAWFVEAKKNQSETVAPTPQRYTESELDNIETILKENEKWMDAGMKKQVPLEQELSSDPVVLTADLEAKGKRLQFAVHALKRKPLPKPPKAPKTSTTSSSASPSGTASPSEEEAPEAPVAEQAAGESQTTSTAEETASTSATEAEPSATKKIHVEL